MRKVDGIKLCLGHMKALIEAMEHAVSQGSTSDPQDIEVIDETPRDLMQGAQLLDEMVEELFRANAIARPSAKTES
jgi:hypothetical protein